MSREDASTDLVDDNTGGDPHLAVYVPGQPPRHVAAKGRMTIGRAGECDVVIDDSSVSRRHVTLTFGPFVQLEDLGGRNGTRVSGKKLDPNTKMVLPMYVMVLGAVGHKQKSLKL